MRFLGSTLRPLLGAALCLVWLTPTSVFAQTDGFDAPPPTPSPTAAPAVATPSATGPDAITAPGTPLAPTPASGFEAAELTTPGAAADADPSPAAAGSITPHPTEGSGVKALSVTPKLNLDSKTAPYNAKAVKKSRMQAVKVASKRKRTTDKVRDIRITERNQTIRRMEKAKTVF